MNPSLRLLAMALVLSSIPQAQAASVEILPSELRGGIQPQVAISTLGSVYISFGRTGTVYCVTSLDGGKSFNSPVKVGSLPKLALGMRRGPRVAVSEAGAVISAISHADGNLYAWVSTDLGATWSASVQINSATNSAREGLHAMVGDSKGTVYTAWLDLRSGKTELWGATSPDAGRTWGENKLIYRSPDGHICECCHPSLAVDSRGHVWAMWRNWLDGARDMYFSVSENGGKTFSAARKLGTGTWLLKGCPMDGGQLAFDGEGGLLTVWRREKAILAASDTGESQLSAQGLHPVVAAASGTTYYLWQSGSKLMLKRGSAEPVLFAPNGTFPVIASASPSSSPVVAWETTTNGVKTIFASRLE